MTLKYARLMLDKCDKARIHETVRQTLNIPIYEKIRVEIIMHFSDTHTNIREYVMTTNKFSLGLDVISNNGSITDRKSARINVTHVISDSMQCRVNIAYGLFFQISN